MRLIDEFYHIGRAGQFFSGRQDKRSQCSFVFGAEKTDHRYGYPIEPTVVRAECKKINAVMFVTDCGRCNYSGLIALVSDRRGVPLKRPSSHGERSETAETVAGNTYVAGVNMITKRLALKD